MHTAFSAFDLISHQEAFATRSLTRLAVRLPLSSLRLAGTGPQRRRFAAVTPPDAPSSTSNYSF
ncbi:hypothetical protein [Thiobacillus sp.]|uniref:hypothetical protein n=1 Tax=Thiobacillus sp. TaxID=924 RepID=UPI0011D59B1D|nr:hypothetical protein [Thiobacillus sp.]TXH74927.1 MAG: hypothetical protein E6Q82_08025 [Thiobacillus sp.]